MLPSGVIRSEHFLRDWLLRDSLRRRRIVQTLKFSENEGRTASMLGVPFRSYARLLIHNDNVMSCQNAIAVHCFVLPPSGRSRSYTLITALHPARMGLVAAED